MDLNSGCVIMHSSKIAKMPIAKVVIDAVEAMAECQGFKSLKFKNRDGIVFCDTDWTAGVDYEENQNKNEDDEDYNEEYHQEDDEDEEQVAEIEVEVAVDLIETDDDFEIVEDEEEDEDEDEE